MPRYLIEYRIHDWPELKQGFSVLRTRDREKAVKGYEMGLHIEVGKVVVYEDLNGRRMYPIGPWKSYQKNGREEKAPEAPPGTEYCMGCGEWHEPPVGWGCEKQTRI